MLTKMLKQQEVITLKKLNKIDALTSHTRAVKYTTHKYYFER